MTSKLSTFILAVALAISALLGGCDSAPPPTNLATAKQKATQCVEPTDVIRRNHMELLKHQRDATVIEGIRTKEHSLNECINCHVPATKQDGSPMHYGDKEHFCTTCHAYAGVTLDCFQCHADRPRVMQDPNYQHKVGSVEGQNFSGGVAHASSPTAADIQMVAQPKGAAQ